MSCIYGFFVACYYFIGFSRVWTDFGIQNVNDHNRITSIPKQFAWSPFVFSFFIFLKLSLSLSLLPPFHSTFAISFFFVRSSAIFNELVCVWTSPSLAEGIVWLLAELLKENVFLTNYIKFCLESHFSSSSVTNMKTIVKRKKIGSTTNAEMYIWIFTTQFSMSLITIARSSLSSMRSFIFFYFFLSFLVICSVVFVTFRSSQICIQL